MAIPGPIECGIYTQAMRSQYSAAFYSIHMHVKH